jgi:hypothetical protein
LEQSQTGMSEEFTERPRTLLRSEECSTLKFHLCRELTPCEDVDGPVSRVATRLGLGGLIDGQSQAP